jgi:hypothetical protein
MNIVFIRCMWEQMFFTSLFDPAVLSSQRLRCYHSAHVGIYRENKICLKVQNGSFLPCVLPKGVFWFGMPPAW